MNTETQIIELKNELKRFQQGLDIAANGLYVLIHNTRLSKRAKAIARRAFRRAEDTYAPLP